MTRAELDAVIAARRAKLQSARGDAVMHAKPPPKPQSPPVLSDKPPPKLTSPVAPPASDRQSKRAELLAKRPPAGYLAGDPEDFRRYVGPGGEISPAPFGSWWGPI